MAKANASGLAEYVGKGDQRPFFLMDVNGGEASLRWINSFLEETAHHLINQQPICLIYNMFYTKQYFWIELFLEFYTEKCRFYKRSHRTFCDRWESAYGTSHSFLWYL